MTNNMIYDQFNDEMCCEHVRTNGEQSMKYKVRIRERTTKVPVEINGDLYYRDVVAHRVTFEHPKYGWTKIGTFTDEDDAIKFAELINCGTFIAT